jgi:SAM-dependent methyltransferase
MKPTIRSGNPENATEQVDRCELCGGTIFDPELTAGEWTLLRCRACGLVFTSPRYSNDYLQKKYAQDYYEAADRYLSTQLAPPQPDELALARRLFRKCKRTSEPQRRYLEIGCGAGRIVEAFQRAGWDAWGYDRSLKAAELGKLRGVKICAGDISQAPLEYYDLVAAFHVLEHIPHPQEFLSACRSRLRPGGFLLLEVPDYDCKGARAMKESWPYLYPEIHLFQYTRTTFRRLVEQGNFHIVRMSRVGGRGPFDEPCNTATRATKAEPRKSWRTRLFEFRKFVYWIPGARPFVRYVLWQILGFGEAVRILARRTD